MNPVTIDICIATYRRPGQLEKLLESLAVQQLPNVVEYRVIVIDNDRDRSATPVIERARLRLALDIVADCEPEKNISLTRNRAFTHTAADYVATIDDDAVARPGWLASLLDTMQCYQADAVIGRVVRELPETSPQWVADSGVYQMPNPPTGSTSGFAFHTCSSLTRRDCLAQIPGPFDASYGITGGGDTQMFHQLQQKGARLVWCSTPDVSEQITGDRLRLRWVVRRHFRHGNTLHRIFGKWMVHPDKPLPMRIFGLSIWTAHSLVRIALLTVAGLFRCRAWSDALRIACEVAFNLGIAAHYFGYTYAEYKEMPPQTG